MTTFYKYPEPIPERLAFVWRARELGFTLDQVRAFLNLASRGQDACAEVREIAGTHLADVRAKIADPRAMERALAQVVRECGTGEMVGCPVISALSSATACPWRDAGSNF